MVLSLLFFCIHKRCDDRLGNTQLALPFPLGTLIRGRACGLWLREVRGRLLPKSRGSCRMSSEKKMLRSVITEVLTLSGHWS